MAAIRRDLGLDQPFATRYVEWLFGAMQGDFGASLANRRSVSDLIANRLGNTLFLALYAAAIAVPLSLTLGILAALFRNTVFDRASNALALTSISFPEFFVAYILILWLSQAGLFPSISRLSEGISFGDKLYRSFLPALTLTLVVTAHMMRMTRATIINLLASPYIEMARLKGMRPLRVILHHALPNALGADPERDRAEPGLSHHRRRGGRGRVRLSRPRAADGRQCRQARHSGRAGGRADLRGGLCAAEPDGRHPVDAHRTRA